MAVTTPTTPLPANIGTYAGRKLGGQDWQQLQQYGYNPGQFGQTIGGYQVYGYGPGDVRLKSTAPAPAPGAAPAPAGTTPGTTGTTQSSSYSGPIGAAPGTSPGIQGAFQKSLLSILSTDPNKVSLTDPDLAPQAQAFRNAQQRNLEESQRAMAEQAFAGGNLGAGVYPYELANLKQQQGEATAQYNADLLGNARSQRMANLLSAMGLNVQNTLGQGDLALRGQLGRGQLGLGLLQALLGNQQFNDQLGLNAGEFAANLNQNALLKSLGL